MKKIAYTIFFLIFLVILMFYFSIDEKGGFDKKQTTGLTESENYCLFKNGELKKEGDNKLCIINEVEYSAKNFFIESLREIDLAK